MRGRRETRDTADASRTSAERSLKAWDVSSHAPEKAKASPGLSSPAAAASSSSRASPPAGGARLSLEEVLRGAPGKDHSPDAEAYVFSNSKLEHA